MKRQTFLLSSAGAALAGCAGPALPPSSLVGPLMRSMTQDLGDIDSQLLGSLLLSPYDFVPRYFEKCHGQLLPIKTNLALFTLLGIRFGGNGKDDFALPDMRKHEPIKGLSYLIATAGLFPKRKGFEPNLAGIPPLLGQLSLVAYLPEYTPPPGWAKCDGQLLNIDHHHALYTLLGTKFGGDGQTTFGLPDLRKHELMKGITYVIALTGRFPNGK